jgi:hypothetical protein
MVILSIALLCGESTRASGIFALAQIREEKHEDPQTTSPKLAVTFPAVEQRAWTMGMVRGISYLLL